MRVEWVCKHGREHTMREAFSQKREFYKLASAAKVRTFGLDTFLRASD